MDQCGSREQWLLPAGKKPGQSAGARKSCGASGDRGPRHARCAEAQGSPGRRTCLFLQSRAWDNTHPANTGSIPSTHSHTHSSDSPAHPPTHPSMPPSPIHSPFLPPSLLPSIRLSACPSTHLRLQRLLTTDAGSSTLATAVNTIILPPLYSRLSAEGGPACAGYGECSRGRKGKRSLPSRTYVLVEGTHGDHTNNSDRQVVRRACKEGRAEARGRKCCEAGGARTGQGSPL